MTRPSRRSRFPDGRALVVAAALALAALPGRAAWAQACCAGGTVVTPARLALHEDAAVGVQLRARTNQGSFGPSGRYAASDGLEQIFEQDFAATFRVFEKAQLGAVLPVLQTHRSASGLDDWGGGVGDLALTARYDFLLPTETVSWPGVALLAAATLPTGRPTDGATHPLAADATGAGTYDATLGVGLEKVVGHLYFGVNGWITHRFARTQSPAGMTPLTQSFSARFAGLAAAGYVFDSEAALALYVNTFDEGPSTLNGAQDPTTRLRLTTVGGAFAMPLGDRWRAQGAIYGDVPIAAFGRNEPAGFGMSATLVRAWL